MSYPQIWTNNATALLGAGISSTATELSVQSGQGATFPNPGPGQYFLITLERISNPLIREIVKVTGRTGDHLTGLVRGYEGSVPQDWSGSDTLVDHRLTAQTIADAFLYPLGAGSGTVTSVGLSGGSTGLTSTGSPVTTSGTLVLDGVLNVAHGGTGLTALGAALNLLGVDSAGTALEYKTLVAGSNVSIVNSPGQIVISATGGGGGSLELYAENPSAPSPPSATGDNAVAIGQAALAEGDDSIALGPQSVARSPGSLAWTNGRFGGSGDSQFGRYALRATTTNSVPIQLYMPNNVQLVMPDDSTWTFKATITAHCTSASDGHAGFEFKGVVYRGSGPATIDVQGSVSKQVIARSAFALNVAADVDVSTGALIFTATGQNGRIFRWLAVVETVEITN